MKKNLFIFLAICSTLVFSCNKNENNDTPIVSNTYSITIAGQINDENGQGIPNVTVRVGNKIDQTDGNGIYLIEKANVNKSRAVVKATKTGYWDRSIGFIPSKSTVQYCNLVMPQKAVATSIQSTTGGSVTSTGATVVFPSNAFVTATGLPYNGTVNITSKHLATTDPNFGEMIPGGDLMAEDSASNSVKLISYGMIGVELSDNSGNPLQLGPGMKASIQLPIASTQLSIAPASIPLWYFDETKSLWIQEGIATKQGNNYVGQVSHFSWWNCDYPTPAATISGYVYDNYGNAIVNAIIYYNNFGGVFTDQNGFYSGQVPSGFPSTIYATSLGVNSAILNIPALTSGQLYNVPEIILNGNSFGKFKANFVDCNNQPTNVCIQFNGATGNSFIYSPNGIVNAVIQCGSQTLNASNLNTQFDTSFTQPCYPDSVDLGTIVICDTSTNTGNIFFEFNLISSAQNINFIDANPSTITTFFNDSSFQLQVYSSFSQDFFNCYFENFFSYSPGTYTFQSPGFFEIYCTNATILPDTLNPNLNFTILQNGLPGDTLEFMINGNILYEDWITNLQTPGFLTNFHVKCIRGW